MDSKTAREYAEECRRIAEQCAGNDVAKSNWLRMAEAFEADADQLAYPREHHSPGERSALERSPRERSPRERSAKEQGGAPGRSHEQ